MINSKKTRLTMFAASMVAAGALTGCFNDKSSDPSSTSFGGGASLGALVGATCNVTDSTPTALSVYTTDGNGEGTVAFTGDAAYPIFISCTGGDFFDEANPTGGAASDGFRPNDGVLRSIIPDADTLAEVQADGGKVAVTTLTSMAAALYDSLPATKKNPTAARESISNVVKAIYPDLLVGGGIKNVLKSPTVVKADAPELNGTAGKYAAVLAGLAQIAKDQNKSPSQLATELASAAATLSLPSNVTSAIVGTTNTYAQTTTGTAKTTTSGATQGSGTVDEPTGVTEPVEPTGGTGGTGGTGNGSL